MASSESRDTSGSTSASADVEMTSTSAAGPSSSTHANASAATNVPAARPAPPINFQGLQSIHMPRPSAVAGSSAASSLRPNIPPLLAARASTMNPRGPLSASSSSTPPPPSALPKMGPFDPILKEISELQKLIVSEMRRSNADIARDVARLRTEMEEKFQTLTNRFEGIETAQSTLKTLLNKSSNETMRRVEEVKSDGKAIRQYAKVIKHDVEVIKEDVVEVRGRVDGIGLELVAIGYAQDSSKHGTLVPYTGNDGAASELYTQLSQSADVDVVGDLDDPMGTPRPPYRGLDEASSSPHSFHQPQPLPEVGLPSPLSLRPPPASDSSSSSASFEFSDPYSGFDFASFPTHPENDGLQNSTIQSPFATTSSFVPAPGVLKENSPMAQRRGGPSFVSLARSDSTSSLSSLSSSSVNPRELHDGLTAANLSSHTATTNTNPSAVVIGVKRPHSPFGGSDSTLSSLPTEDDHDATGEDELFESAPVPSHSRLRKKRSRASTSGRSRSRRAPSSSTRKPRASTSAGTSAASRASVVQWPELKEASEHTRQVIVCDGCDRWYHFSCVGLENEPSEFVCPICVKFGSSSTKTRRSARDPSKAVTHCLRPDCPAGKSEAKKDEFFVESLVGRRGPPGHREYLVYWEGWKVRDCTWQVEGPDINLAHLPREFEEFEVQAALEGFDTADPTARVVLARARACWPYAPGRLLGRRKGKNSRIEYLCEFQGFGVQKAEWSVDAHKDASLVTTFEEEAVAQGLSLAGNGTILLEEAREDWEDMSSPDIYFSRFSYAMEAWTA